jgi:hypothetical protein
MGIVVGVGWCVCCVMVRVSEENPRYSDVCRKPVLHDWSTLVLI